MPQTLREFVSFLLALWREGKALVMGGSIFFVIAIWGLITGRSVPANIAYLLLAVTFTWAGFLAWRKEVREVGRLRTALGYERPGLIFVDEAPSFLTQFSKGHMSIQAAKLLQPYLGKWMKLSNVTVDNIEEHGTEHRVLGSSSDGTTLFMYFKEQWSERILILRRGSTIAIIGQIMNIDSGGPTGGFVQLQNCEIMGSSAISNPGQPSTQI
jgi:hypothetical protein